MGLSKTNPYSSAAGIPTLSGTGAEVSWPNTALTGQQKKLGTNLRFHPFDQIILDPELTAGAPANQRFYTTGMDCYIHVVIGFPSPALT
jgi:3-deoxy-alpha-D-manno-octulosonate 8-oxidase